MGLLLREKKDGRRTFGYLVYLIGGLGAMAAVAWIHRRAEAIVPEVHASRLSPAAEVPQGGPKAGSTAQAGISAGPTADGENRHPPRGPGLEPAVPESSASPDGSFDAISATLDTTRAEGSSAAKLPPAWGGLGEDSRDETLDRSPAPAARPTQGGAASLLGYRDPSADFDGADGPGRLPIPVRNAADGRVPRGTLIDVYLLTDVDTGNDAAIIQFGEARALVFNHREQLSFGTRFLGRFSGQIVRDRATLTADTILLPDGREMPISADAVEADETGAAIYPGIPAYYYPPPAWAQIAPYVSDFITGYLGLLQSRAQPQLAISTGGIGVQSVAGASPVAPLYEASSQAIQNFTQARLKEIEQRYASHYFIPAGTECWLELMADLDLGPALPDSGAGRWSAYPPAPTHDAAH
jgi:hypothetical protein